MKLKSKAERRQEQERIEEQWKIEEKDARIRPALIFVCYFMLVLLFVLSLLI